VNGPRRQQEAIDLAERAWHGVQRAAARPLWRRLFVAGILLVIAAASLGTLVVMTQLRQSPVWWRTVMPTDPDTIQKGEQVERGMLQLFYRDRTPGEPWSVQLTASQANAWLNTRLPKWLKNRELGWPEMLTEIQSQFDDDRISLGFRIETDDGAQIVAATVAPVVDQRGALWLTISSTRAGRLDLPRGWTIERLRTWLPEKMTRREATDRVLKALDGEAPLLGQAVVPLDGGRQVRIRDILATGGNLELRCVTEWTEASYAGAAGEQ